ncbi:hypothetical protein TNCV_3389601 [Trichonephila clavipes]|nr:hypothetical protein TNCV_3389601 [Trichonephila clavipes]
MPPVWSDRGPRNSSWQGARSKPVVDLGFEHNTGANLQYYALSVPRPRSLITPYLGKPSLHLLDLDLWERDLGPQEDLRHLKLRHSNDAPASTPKTKNISCVGSMDVL